MNDKKKILFFITSLGGGGAEKVLVNLVNALPKDEFDVTLKTLYGGSNENDLAPEVKYSKLIKTENKFLRWLLVRLYYKLLPNSWYYKFFLKGDYDIECAYLEGKTTEIIAASNNEKSKKLAFIHTDIEANFGTENLYGSEQRAKKLYKKMNEIVCCSEGVKKSFCKTVGKEMDVRVLYNVIDFEQVKVLADEFEAEKRDQVFRIVSMGRLCEVKGYSRLLKALKTLKEKNVSYELQILGEGELKTELEEYARTEELNVKFLGFKKNPFPFIKSADLYVCSSYAEGYNTAIIEALSLGVPVLTTDCAGMEEIIKNNIDGIIVENSEEGLTEGLLKLIEDRACYSELKKNARNKSCEYSKKNEVAEYIKLLLEE